MENSDVKKIINKHLDSLMKSNGFKRVDRTYYKQYGEYIFTLQSEAVGNYFSTVTKYPSHSFSLTGGLWVSYISPYIRGEESAPQFPKKKDKKGNYIPNVRKLEAEKIMNLNRVEKFSLKNIGISFGVSELEMQRTDLWVFTDSQEENIQTLSELEVVVQQYLERCKELQNKDILKDFLLKDKLAGCSFELLRNNIPLDCNGNDKAFRQLEPYLQFAMLYYKKHGTRESFKKIRSEYEKWIMLYNRSAWAKCLGNFKAIPSYCYEDE